MFKILLLFAINLCFVNLEKLNSPEDNFISFENEILIDARRKLNIDDQEENTLVQLVRDYFGPLIEFGTTDHVRDPTSRRTIFKTTLPEPVQLTLKCYRCLILAKTILRYFHSGLPPAGIKAIATQFCIKSLLVPEEVCRGVIELNVPILIYILDKRPELTANDICEIFSQPDCLKDINYEGKINSYKYFTKKIPKVFKEKKSLTPLKIIQVSDIHYDPAYQEKSNADCDEPLCCRVDSGELQNDSSGAGNWGDYRSCDVPHKLINNAFLEIRRRHPDTAMIFYTGDSVPHNVWSTTFEGVKSIIGQITDDFTQHFPDVPIYPILGNHDTQPVNQFAPSEVYGEFNSTWLFEYVAKDWKKLLPESALNTLRQYGFYAVHHSKRLKIISLNSNVAYTYNWWLFYDDEFFFGQLEWLVIELIESEMQEQFVYILSHVPPGEKDSYIKWQIEYQNIKVRFSHIIKAEFSGHTHMDQLRLVYTNNNVTNPIGVVYNGGSLTPFEFVNPNYRVYYADPNTFDIIDYEQWIFNLTQANEDHGSPDWFPLYTFKEAYNLDSAQPIKLNQFIDNLKTNKTLFEQYRRFEIKDANYAPLQDCSDPTCKRQTLCEIITTLYKDRRVCNALLGNKKKKFEQYYDIRDNICYKRLNQLTNMIAGAASYIDCLTKCHV
ncbi:sphingomyelin phosphodiesterase 1-like [Chrysoperla carnea]|uniref:sphingomyelin phosphodiesterase 1-like n=1 Tax=Chrysoperla carnea TaxID=189513 RepID=UPI001D08B43E|nr:sphingomyelin phosphodiesterase 1-like [Chrysoperla carnea]XP_044728678.1 sphingomyelin phosphodiesterase 1-like [Chrysoperla carnea]